MQRIIRYIKSHSRLLAITIGSLVGIAGLLLYKLSSLTVHLSQGELQQQAFSSSWRHISADPLNLPYTALQWLFLTLFSHHGTTVTRLASVMYGALALLAFMYIIRRWYGIRTAVFGAVLFATSSWFLHVSRYGGTEVLYLWAVPTMLAVQIAWERHAKLPWISWAAVAILGLLLYVPGMIWLIILSFGLHPGQLLRSWQHTRKWWQWAIIGLLVVLFLGPLLLAMAKHPSLVQTWIGLPKHFAEPGHIGHQLVHTISFLAYRGPIDPQLWLDRLPIFDIFTLAMFALGVIFYARHALAPRTRQIIGLWLVGAVFFALGGPVSFSILIPTAYLIVTAGLGYLLHEWLHVFPRNALARAAGYSLLSLVVLAAATYNLRAYFIAWPHSPSTITTYQIPRT